MPMHVHVQACPHVHMSMCEFVCVPLEPLCALTNFDTPDGPEAELANSRATTYEVFVLARACTALFRERACRVSRVRVC